MIATLKEFNVSQLPVVSDDGELLGIVSEVDLLNHMLSTNHAAHDADETIAHMINTDVPIVSPNTNLETLMAHFASQPAVVLATGHEIQGILTKIDILDYLSTQPR